MHISHSIKSRFNFLSGFKLFWIAIKIWHLIFLWFDAKPLNLGIKYLNKIRNLQYLNVNVFMNKPHLGLFMKKEWPAYIAFTINFDHLVGLLHHLKTMCLKYIKNVCTCKLPWEWEHPLIYQRAEQSQTSQRLGLGSRWIDWGRSGIYQALWVLWCHPFWTKQRLSRVNWDLPVQTTGSWYWEWSRSSWCHQQKTCKSEINGEQVCKMDGRTKNSESFPKNKYSL